MPAMGYAPTLTDDDLAAFEGIAVIHDKAKFRARLSGIVAREIACALEPSTQVSGAMSFRAGSRWEPSSQQLRHGRALLLNEFRQPHNLPLAQFAELAGKSRQQIYKDVSAQRLLALSVGARGQRIPDWQLDETKKKLTQALLEAAQGVDVWTLYFALIEPNRDFSGRPPIEAVSPGNLKRTLGTLLGQLGFHA